jgi:hypothetical protein
MRRTIATLETGIGVRVRLILDGDTWKVTRWSRSNHQWIAYGSFESFEEAMAVLDDQIHEAIRIVTEETV